MLFASRTLVCLAALLIAGLAYAQERQPHEIKSAYLVSLPNYISWPNEHELNQFVIGVLGDDKPLFDTLSNGARGRTVRGKPILIRAVNDIDSMRNVQLLFITSASPVDLATVARQTRRTNTLLISDDNPDQVHTMINLIRTAANTIAFEVNKQNIVYEGLTMDRDVLLLGGTELDVAELLVATEQELSKGRAELQSYEARMQDLQGELDRQDREIKDKAAAADEANRELAASQTRLAASEQQLRANQLSLEETLLQLSENSQNLDARNAELARMESESLEQSTLIDSNADFISEQEASIQSQLARLADQTDRIDNLDLLLRSYKDWNIVLLTMIVLFLGLIAIVLYISRQKAAINKLLLSQNVELQEAKVRLRQESDRADRASHAKGEFLANMSHEIRTPMTAILGYSELLQQNTGERELQADYVRAINRNSEHLLSLINDILDISKIEAGKVELQAESFDLAAALSDVESMFKLQAEKKRLRLLIDIDAAAPQFVKADFGKLKQILINLVGNAVKFSNHGEVSIAVSAKDDESEDRVRLIFGVADCGIGIEAEKIEDIFSAFEQAQFGRSADGTGLGLAISRYFARMMDGDITVSSEVGVGSVFTCEVVVDRSDASTARDIATKGQVGAIRGSKPEYRVVVADDNYENRDLIVHILNMPGIATREATDGLEALEVCRTWRPDLIFLDLSMPNMRGEEALSLIRSEPEYKDLKVVILTANVFEETRKAMATEGADGFLRKPFRKWEILSELAAQLGVGFEMISDDDSSRKPDRPAYSATRDKKNNVPTKVLRRLADATASLDRKAMKALIGEIEAIDQALASELQLRIERFEYEGVEELISSYRRTA